MESSEGFGERIRNVQRRVARFWKREDGSATSVQILRESLAGLNRRLEELQAHEQELQRKVERLGSARESLEATRNWYRAIALEVPAGYLVTDRDGVVREANGAAGRLIGVSPELLKDRSAARRQLSATAA
jgi:PAS domain-containing protein